MELSLEKSQMVDFEYEFGFDFDFSLRDEQREGK